MNPSHRELRDSCVTIVSREPGVGSRHLARNEVRVVVGRN